MGYISSSVRFLLVIAIVGLCLPSVASASAEERTYSYTIPNSTPISMGYVNDTFDFRAGDEVTFSWVSDMDLLFFNIKCSEFSDQYHVGCLIKWSGNFSIRSDCTVLLEWFNDKDVPAHVELTIVTVPPSLFEDPSFLWAVSIALAIVLVVVIALLVKRRSGRSEADAREALEVTALPDRGVEGVACAHCGSVNPPDAEFCGGCSRPTDRVRRGIG